MVAVVAQDINDELQEITDRTGMKIVSMEENKVWYSQATRARTLFTQKPLLGDFGYLAVRTKAREVYKVSTYLLQTWIPTQ